jgi:YD repeat-containing protein
MRFLLLVVLMVLGSVPGAAASVTAGVTSCAVDFNARVGNLDCVVAAGDVQVDLQGGLSIAVPVAGGEQVHFAYDAAGELVSATVDEATTAYQYDDTGRLLRSGETRYAYDALGRVTAAGDWRFAYGDLGLVQVVAPDGSTTRYSYDKYVDVTSIDSVSFLYGAQRRVLSINESGETTDYEYDKDGEPVRRTSGDVVAYSYDRRGNLVGSVSDSGETIDYEYSGRSLLRAVAAGPATRFSYDAAGRLVSANGTQFAYDGDGRLLAVVPEIGDEVVVSFEHGDLSRPIVVGYLWGDSHGDSFTLSDRGKLKTCSRCP